MHTWIQDLRYAWRSLRKNVLSTLAILASLGIGATSAVFSVVDALLLRPLPYPQPERLAAVWLHSPPIGIFHDWPSPGQFLDSTVGGRGVCRHGHSRLADYQRGSGDSATGGVAVFSVCLPGIPRTMRHACNYL
jgi:hypothetical protein